MSLLREDRALLKRFREGQKEALTRVYMHYVDQITDLARRGALFSSGAQVGGSPAHEVYDLVQETFVRAFSPKARQAYDGIRDYGPYLRTICRNLLADAARRRGREIPTDFDDLPVDAGEPRVESDDWADKQTIALVRAYVGSLKPPLDQVYRLRFIEGASQARTAELLKLGRQRIRTYEKRIRRGLAERLEP